MTELQKAIGNMGAAIVLVALAGIVWRRRFRQWVFFSLFLANILAYSVLVIVSSERFYRQEVYMVKEAILHLVRLAMALELAIRTFRAFPGAMATLRRMVFLVLAITVLVVVLGTP